MLFFLSNKFQAGTAKSAFFHVCAHAVHVMLHTQKHSSLKNEIINLTNVGKDGTVTESHNS